MASSSQPTTVDSQARKAQMPKSWQWLLRITGLIAILLFLLPSFYVVKYFSIDQPNEYRIVKSTLVPGKQKDAALGSPTADDFAALGQIAKNDPSATVRVTAISRLQALTEAPGMVFRRPMETLLAKATLGDIAAHDSNAQVRTAASQALAHIAQGGAIIQR